MVRDQAIDTFIINLSSRTERRLHIVDEFSGRAEYNWQIVNAVEHEIGAVSLWNTIRHILADLAGEKEYIIICEDDHQFTDHYTSELLFTSISEAMKYNADLLLGGVSWFKDALQISSGLFWTERFTGLQFTILFRHFYQHILNAHFELGNAADLKISQLSTNKLIVHPYLSIQKEFGYSDVTIKNGELGYVSKLFSDSHEKLDQLRHVLSFYRVQ